MTYSCFDGNVGTITCQRYAGWTVKPTCLGESGSCVTSGHSLAFVSSFQLVVRKVRRTPLCMFSFYAVPSDATTSSSDILVDRNANGDDFKSSIPHTFCPLWFYFLSTLVAVLGFLSSFDIVVLSFDLHMIRNFRFSFCFTRHGSSVDWNWNWNSSLSRDHWCSCGPGCDSLQEKVRIILFQQKVRSCLQIWFCLWLWLPKLNVIKLCEMQEEPEWKEPRASWRRCWKFQPCHICQWNSHCHTGFECQEFGEASAPKQPRLCKCSNCCKHSFP